MSTKTLALVEQRSALERRANVIRSRLLRTIDALDTRRHQVQELGHHAKRLAAPAAASVLGVAVLAAGVAFGLHAVLERRRERSFSYRFVKALGRRSEPKRPPFWREAVRRVTLSTLVLAVTELAKRGAVGLLRGRVLPIGALAPHAPRQLVAGPSAPQALTNASANPLR